MKVYPLKVEYEIIWTRYRALQLFKELPDVIACDFEVANKLTKKQQETLIARNTVKGNAYTPEALADGLSHPSRTVITHLSIGVSPTKAYVIVCEDNIMRRLVYNFLVTTDKLQVWHNTCFDFRHIFYHTGKLPKNYKDSMLMLKSLINNADNVKALVSLKEVQGYKYGKWATSKDNFTLEQIRNPELLEYAAIDGSSTYDLYLQLIEEAYGTIYKESLGLITSPSTD